MLNRERSTATAGAAVAGGWGLHARQQFSMRSCCFGKPRRCWVLLGVGACSGSACLGHVTQLQIPVPLPARVRPAMSTIQNYRETPNIKGEIFFDRLFCLRVQLSDAGTLYLLWAPAVVSLAPLCCLFMPFLRLQSLSASSSAACPLGFSTCWVTWSLTRI